MHLNMSIFYEHTHTLTVTCKHPHYEFFVATSEHYFPNTIALNLPHIKLVYF